jgi:hypothetical protein
MPALSAALAVATVLLGIAMLVSTIARGGGPLTVGVLLGVLFVVGGGLRLYVMAKVR